MKITLINNKFVTAKNAKISVFSDAFLRGYGVFETLRTYNKKLFQTNEHLNRLFKSAKAIDLKINFSTKKIAEMLEKIAKKSPHKIQRIRITAIPETLIITSESLKIDPKIYQGVSCLTVKCIRSLPEVKSISFLPSYISHTQASKKGFFEAILVNEKNEITEGAYSNIFWFENNILFTRKDQVLKGITRETVLKISPFKIKFKTIKLKELIKKEEIFLTSSINGIVSITKINKQKISTGKPGEKTKMLTEKFIKLLPS